MATSKSDTGEITILEITTAQMAPCRMMRLRELSARATIIAL